MYPFSQYSYSVDSRFIRRGLTLVTSTGTQALKTPRLHCIIHYPSRPDTWSQTVIADPQLWAPGRHRI